MADHIDIGLRGEELAANYLLAHGWQIAERRWRDPSGGRGTTDIDIIAVSPDGVYHFVEVKTRTSSGSEQSDFVPEAAVTPAKAQRMILAAERYMTLQGLEREIALDLAAIIPGKNRGTPEIRYYPDVAR